MADYVASKIFNGLSPVNFNSLMKEYGIELSVPVKAVEDITIVIPSARKNDIKITPVLNQGSLKAPVEPDTVVGKLEVKLDDKVLATTDISTAGSVEKAGFFRLLVRFILNLFR